MNWARRFSAITCATLLTLGVSVHAQTVLNLGHTSPPDGHWGQGAQALADTVKELSGGKLIIRHNSSGSLGGERDLVEGAQIGSVDIALVSSGIMANFVPETRVFDLPYLFNSFDDARAVLDGPIGQDLLQKVEKAGVVPLAWGENGFRQIFNSVRPVDSLQTLKGLKLRTQENDLYIRAFQAAGASPVPMSWPDVFSAMQQKVLDGLENPIAVLTSMKAWEIGRYLTMTNHAYGPTLFIMSPSTWARLSTEEREWIMLGAKAAGRTTREVGQKTQDDGIQQLKNMGVEVIEDFDTEALRQAMTPAYDLYKSQNGDSLLNQILSYRK